MAMGIFLDIDSTGGSKGARVGGSLFFHFDIQNFQNVGTLEVGTVSPLREILDPPLGHSDGSIA